MTLKTRLITTISMFFLVIALLITGVWAASSATVNIGGTVSFNATNIYATITGSISGASTTPTLSPLNYSAKSNPGATELNTWKQNLTFADGTTPTIKWTVTIENKSERALYVTLTDNIATLANATKTLTFDNGSADGEKTIPANTTKTFTMEIKVTDTNASASVEYDFNFILRDTSTNIPSWAELEYDESAMTATIKHGTIVDTGITEAYIPAKVTKVGKEYDVVIGEGSMFGGIFNMCKSLKRVIIADGITSIGNFAFHNTPVLEEVVLPKTILGIGTMAFSNCKSLTSITIPDSVTSIADNAFANCKALTTIIIPNSVESIGKSAFSGCTGLTSITISNNITTISQEMFSGCTSLTSITIPESVTLIKALAFSGCTNLTEVNIKATSVPTGVANMFNNCPSSLVIYVPTASVSAYKSDSVWSNFSTQIQGKNF